MMDQPPVIVIEQDLGGRVGDYIMAAQAARKAGARVQIVGPCASSCTIWTSLPPERVCVGPRAGLGFHRTNPGMGDAAASDIVLLTYYPGAVKRWLAEGGGLTSDVRWLFGSRLRAMFAPCKSAARAF